MDLGFGLCLGAGEGGDRRLQSPWGCLDACELPDMPAYIYHPDPHLYTSLLQQDHSHHYSTTTTTQPLPLLTQSLPNHYSTTTTTNMSSPAAQYVYIPNLVGRQMLRIPLEDVEVDDIVSYTPISSQTTSTTSSPSPPPFARTVSRSPSISSVESTE
jgi:hypothetical protein